MIPAGTSTLLYGDGGSGKSLLALQLAVGMVASGRWLGMEVKRGGALVLSAEVDQDENDRRLHAIASAEGVAIRDLRGLAMVDLMAEPDPMLARLDAARGIVSSPLFGDIERHVAATRPALVVVDTLAATFPGDEIRREQAQAFVGQFNRLGRDYGCAVLMLAHPSISGMNSGRGASGSTGWSNAARSRLYLDVPKVPDVQGDRVLNQSKSNYGPTGKAIKLRWQNRTFQPVVSEQGKDGKVRDDHACQVFLRMLDVYANEGRNVAAGGGIYYAPRVFHTDKRSDGISARKLADAMNELFASGQIVNEEFGPPSKRRNRIVRAHG